MKGAAIYFSGTGNTKYVVELLVKEFQEKNIQCEMIDILKEKGVSKEYDFYVLASAIHVEVFPDIFVRWIKENLPSVDNKRCIIVSTQASYIGYGGRQINKLLSNKGYDVMITRSIPMPNNYYLSKFFKETPEDRKKEMKEDAVLEVKNIVDKFLKDEGYIEKQSALLTAVSKVAYKVSLKHFHKWPKKSLKVDYNRCTKCKRCVNECPTNNITFGDKIEFSDKCISCFRCVQKCPANAFLYKNRHFNQM
ncbi:(4Fe-4S)-binding protein [Clostridium acetobutylicum]|nr:(4Fe-4S)-binding protein [Clostridium acetobutylicum]